MHAGIGAPSSGSGTTGAASAVYAHTIPTIRNNILTARFMDCSPSGSPGSGDPNLAGIIQVGVNYAIEIVLTEVIAVEFYENRTNPCAFFLSEFQEDKSAGIKRLHSSRIAD